MRVLVSPRVDLARDRAAALVARVLAGEDGTIVLLRERGVRSLERPLSQAEVHWVRQALSGEEERRETVGYVCEGSDLGRVEGVDVVAVADHAGLTWRSPLTGPNDEKWGPRFPSMVGIYATDQVAGALASLAGMILKPGVVAGVADDRSLTSFEAEMAQVEGHLAASSELVPVAIIAGHMGVKLAAAVLLRKSKRIGEG